METIVDPPFRGSLLDADHPENGVLIPRRITDQEMLAEPSIVAIRTVQAYAATLAAAPSSANKAALAEIAAGFADALDHIRALQEGLGEDGDT